MLGEKPGLVSLCPPQIEGYKNHHSCEQNGWQIGLYCAYREVWQYCMMAWERERKLEMVSPLDFFLSFTCSSWVVIVNVAVLKINATWWSLLSDALWHLRQTCCLMYQKKSQHGQIRNGQLKTEVRWRCVLRRTLWSHLFGCRPSHSHYKGKYIAQNASLSWDPSAGLWVIFVHVIDRF
jgi:hypothetical protein